MRNCTQCNRDISHYVSRNKRCHSCRKGYKPKTVRVKYNKELLEEAAQHSVSVAGLMRYLGLSGLGGNHSHITRRLKLYEIDTSHFTGQAHNKGKPAAKRRTWQEILTLRKENSRREAAFRMRRAMVEYGFTEQCSECKLGTTWNGKPIVLHVDHISGIIWDNRPENIRFLCPNCHSQTETYCRPKRD